jgi:hypothetical protein
MSDVPFLCKWLKRLLERKPNNIYFKNFKFNNPPLFSGTYDSVNNGYTEIILDWGKNNPAVSKM